MRYIELTLCASLISVGGGAIAETPQLGESTEYSAGPYTFLASPISFRGRSLGYAEAGHKLQRFSGRYWVFEACAMNADEPGMGACGDWKVLHVASGKLSALRLPQFDSFWSVPAFAWPYVAYMQVNMPSSPQNSQVVYCAVWNFQTKRIVSRKKQVVPEDFFAIDFPGLFARPLVTKNNGTTSFAFGIHEDGKIRTICDLSVP